MAFTLSATVGSTTVTLNDNNPFRLLSARGLSGAEIRRVTLQGPAQHGDTDLGYRLGARDIELQIGFLAATDAVLDGYRDTLRAIFRPLTATPVLLKITRDDGSIRQLDCNLSGELKIDLLPEYRPGHYHLATVRLRAPNPAYYDQVAGTVTTTGVGTALAPDWYLAGGAIGTASVLMLGTAPAQGAAWTYTGTITTTYTLAFRSAQEAFGTASKYAFHVNALGSVDPSLIASTDTSYMIETAPLYLGADFMPAGTTNFYLRYDSGALLAGANKVAFMAGTGHTVGFALPFQEMPIAGTARRWRSNDSNAASSRWTAAIDRYALYSPGLSDSQITALEPFMTGALGGTIGQTISTPYSGDLPGYPIISITGPISNVNITNVVTHDNLSFGTITIGAGTTYIIDTRPGYKTVLQGTTNKRGELSATSDLETFHISPDSPQGINPFVVYGINTGTATQVRFVYYNQYASF